MGQVPADLVRLGELAGMESAFQDGQGVWHKPSLEAYLAILPSLGMGIQKPEQAGELRAQFALEKLRMPLDSVQTVWSGKPIKQSCPLIVQVEERNEGNVGLTLVLESGECRRVEFVLGDCKILDGCRLDGKSWVRRIILLENVPWGVHEVRLDWASDCAGWVIVAPKKAYQKPLHGKSGKWGIFLPVHAMRSEKNHGCGTYTDLGDLLEWTGAHGGGLVGTLPMLAGLSENPCEPSPYSPASRLFWNELYLDLDKIPELGLSDLGRAKMLAPEWLAESQRLKDTSLVEHEHVMRHIRPILEDLATVFPEEGPRAAALEAFEQARPMVVEYARFRAKHHYFQKSWHSWPKSGEGIESTREFLKLVRQRTIWQFWAEEQVGVLAKRAQATGGPGLYLDLPIGVHGDGFDVYRFGNVFAPKVSAGAPPDSFFTKGQDWGFPPPHPWRQRLDGYSYIREVLDHHMRLAGLLRIDHVMGLHRLYWVPWGLGAKEGAYVKYPYEELYAIYCLNSIRNNCSLAGEDLGTVPAAVRPEMDVRGIHRLFVGQFSFCHGEVAMDRPSKGSIASLNTHDLPTFLAFWKGLDILDRQDLMLLDADEANKEANARRELRVEVLRWLGLSAESSVSEESPRYVGLEGEGGAPFDPTLEVNPLEVFIQLTKFLAESEASAVLVNAEDLWLSPDPQNVPGTWKERPNWSRKAQYPLGHWGSLSDVSRIVKALQSVLKNV